MAIKVGIQTVRTSEVSKDDNNNAVLTFSQGEELDPMAALTGDGSLGGADSSKVIVWALKDEGYNNEPITGKRLVEHINEYRAFFNQILSVYFTSEEAGKTWADMYVKLKIKSPVDMETYTTEQVKTIGNEIIEAFINKMKTADLSKEVRVKFWRSSASKNFVTLTPGMGMGYIGSKTSEGYRKTFTVPFIEDAIIPEASTKLKYSDYERGFRNGAQTGLDRSNPDAVKADETPGGVADMPF
jgi:hypothetical protein